ncbi:MAG TPA: hypothetical protein VLZ03_15760 [Thermodesulfobacteriota bacterium]|nr:hypothetical protein [Thermodesulfobacteriota bacterium]
MRILLGKGDSGWLYRLAGERAIFDIQNRISSRAAISKALSFSVDYRFFAKDGTILAAGYDKG